MDMDLSETETMRPVLRSATPTLDGGPRLQEAAPAKITAATRQGNLRVALVGAGYVAQFHRDVLAETPGLNLVAVGDADADRARAAARQWGIPNAVGAVEELRDLAIDVAHVLVPPDLHVKATRALLEMGIGVLLEKPMALASADARELQALADRRNLPLGVNHNNVWHPAFVRLLDHVRAGRIGKVEHVLVCLSVPLAQLEAGDFSHWMFRSPENIVFEQAPHPLSQLHCLIGAVREAKTTILGTRELHPGQIFHDRWLVAARGEKGTAEIYLAFGQGFSRWTLEVLGSDSSAEADLGHNLFSYEEKTPWLEFWNSFLAGWPAAPVAWPPGGRRGAGNGPEGGEDGPSSGDRRRRLQGEDRALDDPGVGGRGRGGARRRGRALRLRLLDRRPLRRPRPPHQRDRRLAGDRSQAGRARDLQPGQDGGRAPPAGAPPPARPAAGDRASGRGARRGHAPPAQRPRPLGARQSLRRMGDGRPSAAGGGRGRRGRGARPAGAPSRARPRRPGAQSGLQSAALRPRDRTGDALGHRQRS